MSPETRKPVASSAQGAGGSGNNSDEIRYRSYLTQLERQQDADIKDKEVQHKDRVTKVIGSQTTKKLNRPRKERPHEREEYKPTV